MTSFFYKKYNFSGQAKVGLPIGIGKCDAKSGTKTYGGLDHFQRTQIYYRQARR